MRAQVPLDNFGHRDELRPSDTGIETAVRLSTSTYGNVIERVQALQGSRLLFVVQPRRGQLQER